MFHSLSRDGALEFPGSKVGEVQKQGQLIKTFETTPTKANPKRRFHIELKKVRGNARTGPEDEIDYTIHIRCIPIPIAETNKQGKELPIPPSNDRK